MSHEIVWLLAPRAISQSEDPALAPCLLPQRRLGVAPWSAARLLASKLGELALPLGGGDWLNEHLNLNANLDLQGAGDVTVDGTRSGTVMAVNGVTISVSNLTLQDGGTDFDLGGGIFNYSNLTLNNNSLSGNTAWIEGGIFNDSGPVTPTSSSAGPSAVARLDSTRVLLHSVRGSAPRG